MDITSSTDTYNTDSSSTENVTSSSIQSKMIQSCGATIEEAQQAVSLVTDESINTNIDNSNTFVNTGDNVTISDVQMETQLDFVGASVDKSCMLDALNELEEVWNLVTKIQKIFGGEGGDISSEAGGNTTSNENTSEKSDQLDAAQTTDASQELSAEATTEQTTENTTDQSASTEQKVVKIQHHKKQEVSKMYF